MNSWAGTRNQIIVAVVIALLVGSSAPWWWKALVESEESQNENVNDSPGGVPEQLSPDFPGGTMRKYSADFSSWPIKESEHGSVRLEFGNSLALEPLSNTWIGPVRPIEIPPLESDFVFDVRFRIAERHPSAGLKFGFWGGGNDAEAIDIYFYVWNDSSVACTIHKGRVRSGGGLGVAHSIVEETIADREQLSSDLTNHDWSNGSKLTLKREGGSMQFFLNDIFVKDFAVSRFPVINLSVAAAFKSKIVITSIEARVKD